MKTLFKFLSVVVLAATFASCQGNGQKTAQSNGTKAVSGTAAKYVFYFIGDGMTAPQVRLAEAALTAPKFQENYAKQTSSTANVGQLNFKSLNVTGLATSNADNRYITDSAAAGTALATGSKTDVGVISESPEGDRLQTIAEKAKEKGMKVGIVSSVSIDHATPACFYAHSASRNEYTNISNQLLTSGFDYFGGGSVKLDSRAKTEGTDLATAAANFKKQAEDKGFKYVSTKAEFDAVGAGEAKPVIATLDMLANDQFSGDGFSMPYTIDLDKQAKEDNKITLAQFTKKGIELLDNEKGFFMMVEGGKIDWACHANDAATCAYEVVAFDEAIGEALKFAAKHPEETLIVVTGDHDCGGLALGFSGTGYDSAFDVLGSSRTSHVEFTAKAVKEIKAGASFDKLLALACAEFGFTNNEEGGSENRIERSSELSDYEVAKLRTAYNDSKNLMNNKKITSNVNYGGYNPFTVTCTHLINNKSGVDYTSYSHTAVPVMVFAHGAREGIFSGYYDNTDIPKRIMQAAEL